jgi:hypothetical protein
MLIIIILITLIILYFLFIKSNKNCCIISKNKYPKLKYLSDNKQIIIDELQTLKTLKQWSKWDATNYDTTTPVFTKMTPSDIIGRIKNNEDYLNSGPKSWRLFGLILFGEELQDNVKMCPNTMKLLKKIPNVINAGFSCLEPDVETELHKDVNRSFYRLNLPLEIPDDGQCSLEVNGTIFDWNKEDYVIFDDTCLHQAKNKTSKNRFILIVDVKR